jgi:hypothetical protein
MRLRASSPKRTSLAVMVALFLNLLFGATLRASCSLAGQRGRMLDHSQEIGLL